MHTFRRGALVRPDMRERDRIFLDLTLTKTIRLFRCVHVRGIQQALALHTAAISVVQRLNS